MSADSYVVSVNQAFSKAVATIKLLSTGPSALKPPPVERRHLLYGLFKQSMEGDVEGIMARPTGGPNAHAAQLKWDAWKGQEGLSRIDAKLEYVRCVLETMQMLAPGALPPAWLELERVYLDALNTPRGVEPLPGDLSLGAAQGGSQGAAPGASAGLQLARLPSGASAWGVPGKLRRRASAASTASTYSHFLDPDFALSARSTPKMRPSPSLPVRVDTPVHAPVHAPAHTPAPVPPQGRGFSVYLAALVQYTSRCMQGALNGASAVMRRCAIDAVKFVTVLVILRVLMLRPRWLQRVPHLTGVLAALGRLCAVVLDEAGVEIHLKAPK